MFIIMSLFHIKSIYKLSQPTSCEQAEHRRLYGVVTQLHVYTLDDECATSSGVKAIAMLTLNTML